LIGGEDRLGSRLDAYRPPDTIVVSVAALAIRYRLSRTEEEAI
jgi:hypothetical protein